MKLLLWLAIGYAIIWLIRNQKANSAAVPHKNKAFVGQQAMTSESMVPCGLCNMYIPMSDAMVNSSGEYFCCEEHRSKKTSGNA
jgi:hypothetical protein